MQCCRDLQMLQVKLSFAQASIPARLQFHRFRQFRGMNCHLDLMRIRLRSRHHLRKILPNPARELRIPSVLENLYKMLLGVCLHEVILSAIESVSQLWWLSFDWRLLRCLSVKTPSLPLPSREETHFRARFYR